MSEEALTPSIKRGFILIRDDFQREGEFYIQDCANASFTNTTDLHAEFLK